MSIVKGNVAGNMRHSGMILCQDVVALTILVGKANANWTIFLARRSE